MRKWLIIIILLIVAVGIFTAFPICLGRIYSHQIIKAVEQNNLGLVKSLLDKGANPNTKNSKGTPLLLLSIRKDYSEITQLLLDEGADVNIKEDAFTDKYPKPGSSEIITLKIGGWTALHRVVSRGNLGLIELLLAKGADINARSCEGRTPLHYAIMFSKEADIVEILLANGADVNAKDNKYGQTPLHMAAMNRLDYFKPEAVKLLLAYGADVDSRNKGGATPMYWACALGNVEAAELLLAGGADVNIQTTKHGSTVLHIASGRGYTDLIRSLLAAGADVNIEDNKSRTPLDMAIENGRTGTAKLLKKHGAKTAAELAASDE